MTDDEFDAALVAAAFELGAEQGWRMVSPAAAAQRAGLDIAATRRRFPERRSILMRFGMLADAYALQAAPPAPPRDRLFDMLLRRFDFLQKHRAGVLALISGLAVEPALGWSLAEGTSRSMGWLLEGAGIPSAGLRGGLRQQGLVAVWAWGTRAWMKDDSADLSATMVAVDTALNRAARLAEQFDPIATAEIALAVTDGPEMPLSAEASIPPD